MTDRVAERLRDRREPRTGRVVQRTHDHVDVARAEGDRPQEPGEHRARRALLERPDRALRTSRRPGREHDDLALRVALRSSARASDAAATAPLVVVADATACVRRRRSSRCVTTTSAFVALEDRVRVGRRSARIHERHGRADAHRRRVRLDELRTVRQHDRDARRRDRRRSPGSGSTAGGCGRRASTTSSRVLVDQRGLLRVARGVERVDEVRLEPLRAGTGAPARSSSGGRRAEGSRPPAGCRGRRGGSPSPTQTRSRTSAERCWANIMSPLSFSFPCMNACMPSSSPEIRRR